MASQILRRNGQRSVAYLPSIRSIIQCLNARCGGEVASITTSASQSQVSADPQRTLGTYITVSHWPHDPQFPLPGNVSVDYSQLPLTSSVGPATTEAAQERRTLVSALLEREDETKRKEGIIKQFIDEQEDEEMGQGTSMPCPSDKVEFSIQDCPVFLRKGFLELFPSIAASGDALTVITISQQTERDMTAWSEEVEEERDVLFETFVDNAKQFCEHLHASGYWADFIDPASGQAYFSEHTNATLFETDDRFNHLGFCVEDLGCCKVIRHKVWGSNVFVGTIFTNAPVDSELFSLFNKKGD